MEHLLIPLLILCCIILIGLLIWSWVDRAVATATIIENDDTIADLQKKAAEENVDNMFTVIEHDRRVEELQGELVAARLETIEVGRRTDQHMEEWKTTEEQRIRKDAKKRSKAIKHGFTQEHFAPFWIDPQLNPRDFRFVGDPIDYLVCVGSSAVSAGQQDEITEIIFMDVKTGNAALSKVQRRIRDAVNEGRVRFVVYNPDKEKEFDLKLPQLAGHEDEE
jgi:predicted Holliday junction resolvase-like endonuclease